MTHYDRVPYTSKAVPLADPDRISVVARMLGLSPAPVERCRVLELGCASGGHLLPLAAARPSASFVGLDVSARQVADGEEARRALGIDNLALLHLDLADADGLGAFDYVVAHGLYSWVPEPIRAALLGRVAASLAPGGVGYVSFNCRPGWHARGEIRRLLLEEVGGLEDPVDRVRRARAHVAWLAERSPSNPWGDALRGEARLLRTVDDSTVFHDLLAPINEPYSLSAFVEALRPHGLAYLGDADFGSMLPERLPPEVQRALGPLGDALQVEARLDQLTGRSFRQALVVRVGTAVDRVVGWERLRGLVVWAVLSRGADGWRTRRGDVLEGATPMVRAALEALASAGAAGLPFEALVARAARRAGADEDPEAVGGNVLQAWIRGAVGVSTVQVPTWDGITRPVAPRVTAWEAATGRSVSNLRHEPYDLDDADRALIAACDGSREPAELRTEGRDRLGDLGRHGFLVDG